MKEPARFLSPYPFIRQPFETLKLQLNKQKKTLLTPTWHPLRLARVNIIGDLDQNLPIDLLRNRSGFTFITEISTAPIGCLSKFSISRKPFALVEHKLAAALRCSKLSDFGEAGIGRRNSAPWLWFVRILRVVGPRILIVERWDHTAGV